MRRAWIGLLVVASLFTAARAQFVNSGAVVGGVKISSDGLLQYRQPAANPATPPVFTSANADHSLVYISLPRALDQWRSARSAGKELPPEVRYLQGMTQIRALFVYPDQHDLILAGPVEKMRSDNPLEAVGERTGRPLMQLEDLVVAMRSIGGWSGQASGKRQDFFGCSLEAPDNLAAVWEPTLKKFGTGPRPRLVAELKKALGPQPVRLFGVPDDSRVATVMVAADYRLKRLSMGLETLPGLGNGLGNTDAGVRFWFEPSYEGVVVSSSLNANSGGAPGVLGYELRGPRLKVLTGAKLFEATPVGAAQAQFAEHMTARIPDLADRIDAIADLQNVMDCFMIAALIREDGLFDKAGIDVSWLLDAERVKVESLPIPKNAETVVHINGNVIAQGGVAVSLHKMGVQRKGAGTISLAARRPNDWWEKAGDP